MPNQIIDDQVNPPTDDTVPFPPMFTSGTDRTSDTPNQIIQTEADTKERLAREDAAKIGNLEAVKLGFETTNNFAVSLGKELYRKSSSGYADPTWQGAGLKDWLKSNAAIVDTSQAWRYQLTDNRAQADALLAESKDIQSKAERLSYRAKDYPLTTGIATIAASLIDIDLPISIATGGYTAEAKSVIALGRLGRMVSAGASAGAANAALAEGAYLSDPTADWTIVPMAGLAGMALGGLVGAARRANVQKAAVEKEFGDNIVEDFPMQKNDYTKPVNEKDNNFVSDGELRAKEEAQAELDKEQGIVRKPTSVDPSIVQPSTGESSVGARQVVGTSQPLNTISSTKSVDIIQQAKDWAKKSGVPQEWFDNFSNLDIKSPVIGAAVRKFQDVLNASPLASDYARLMRTNSAVLQQLAYNTAESSTGVNRLNKNAGALMRRYDQVLRNELKELPDRMQAWMKDNGYSPVAIHTNANATKAWDEAVISELQYRKYKSGQATTNDHVRAAADAVDRWSARELEVRQGRKGEIPEFGTDTMKPTSGYFNQKWLGTKVRNMIADSNGALSWRHVTDAMDEIYGMMHPAMKPKDRRIWAEALVDRMRRTGGGLSMNVRSVMDGDGRGAIEDFLMRQNNMNKQEVDKLLDRLTGNMETAGQKGNTKRRIDVDLRMTASNGIRMMDLIDTDVYGSLSRRSRQAAGAGALARKGIDSRAKLNDIFDAGLKEQELTNIPKTPSMRQPRDVFDHWVDKDKHITREELEQMYAPFLGSGEGSTISPAYRRMMGLTSLGVMGQNGFSQMAEFGNLAAAKGFTSFVRDLPEDIKAAWKHPDSDLSKELRHLGILEPEENLFRYDTVYNLDRAATDESRAWAKFDGLLAKGGRLMGFTNGMFGIRRVQHKIAVTTAGDRIMNHLRNAQSVNPGRMRDWGFDANLEQAVRNEMKHVEFQSGSVRKYNMDKWDPDTAESFQIVLNRVADQQIQRAMFGESSSIFRKDGMAALFWQLKQFPMLAIEKQTVRTLRLADDEAVAGWAYGLAFAGMAYGTKQLLNGNTDRLTLTDIAKGAFNMSNMTGWMPMFSDPVMGVLGLPQFNAFGGRENGPISTPVSLSYLNSFTQIPGAVSHLLNPFVEGTNRDVALLQATPIFGRMVGITYLLNSLKTQRKPAVSKSETQLPEAAPMPKATPLQEAKPLQYSSTYALDQLKTGK